MSGFSIYVKSGRVCIQGRLDTIKVPVETVEMVIDSLEFLRDKIGRKCVVSLSEKIDDILELYTNSGSDGITLRDRFALTSIKEDDVSEMIEVLKSLKKPKTTEVQFNYHDVVKGVLVNYCKVHEEEILDALRNGNDEGLLKLAAASEMAKKITPEQYNVVAQVSEVDGKLQVNVTEAWRAEEK